MTMTEIFLLAWAVITTIVAVYYHSAYKHFLLLATNAIHMTTDMLARPELYEEIRNKAIAAGRVKE